MESTPPVSTTKPVQGKVKEVTPRTRIEKGKPIPVQAFLPVSNTGNQLHQQSRIPSPNAPVNKTYVAPRPRPKTTAGLMNSSLMFSDKLPLSGKLPTISKSPFKSVSATRIPRSNNTTTPDKHQN